MAEIIHLLIEHGVDKGKKITVPPDGARLGRSSKNDIVLIDPLLSRHHCRLFFKQDGRLWLTDLGSANQCLVNDKPIQESALQVGDVLTIGGTAMRVLNNGLTVPQGGGAPAAPSAAAPVDLGLDKDKTSGAPRKIGMGPLIAIACLVIILAVLAWLPALIKKSDKPAPPPPVQVPDTLEVELEKVQATAANIIYYKFRIEKDGTLAVQMDNIQEPKHVRPPEKKAGESSIAGIKRTILDSGFFELNEEYKGIQPDVLEQTDLAITIGARTHRVKVVNRVLPEVLDNVVKAIEVFAKNELGVWASSQYSPEKLKEFADQAFLNAKRFYDEKDVKFDNMARAIKSFEEAAYYLENIEPKPELYAEILTKIKDCKQELQNRYDDQNFRAERAINTKTWDEAARELRIICEMIPDRSDPRNEEARKKLLDVERRLDTK